MKDDLLKIANSLYLVVDDLYKLAGKPEPPKSAHKAAETLKHRKEMGNELDNGNTNSCNNNGYSLDCKTCISDSFTSRIKRFIS